MPGEGGGERPGVAVPGRQPDKRSQGIQRHLAVPLRAHRNAFPIFKIYHMHLRPIEQDAVRCPEPFWSHMAASLMQVPKEQYPALAAQMRALGAAI